MKLATLTLSDHFTFRKLLRFALPTMSLMLFIALYGMIDGFCISNFLGEDCFTAVNFIWPYVMMLGAIGFMFGSGGTALIGKLIGEGKREEANRCFTAIIIIAGATGLLLGVLSDIFLDQICTLLGVNEALKPLTKQYGYFLCSSTPLFIIQCMFQNYMVVADKPRIGFLITLSAGVNNIWMDFLFVGVFKWGIPGAAFATVFSQFIGCIIPIIFFLNKNNGSLLHFVRPKIEFKTFGLVVSNGLSELFSNIAVSLMNIIYNYQFLNYIGEKGVAAYGVIQYICFIFMSIFFGYMMGVGPIISYNYGAKNIKELSNVFKKSLIFIAIFGAIMTCLGVFCAKPLSIAFVSYDEELLELTRHGFTIFSLGYVLMGFNIFSSALFTALNNGKVSLLISFSRTFVFQIVCLIFLPMIFGIDGIWVCFAVSEFLALIITFVCILVNRKKYNY